MYKVLYGIADGNNFFCSCERVFQPYLRNLPVIVLSSNDGNAIARSNESKALGIKMGVPEFQIKDIIRNYNVQVFSSNYELYSDMSSRMVTILATFAQDIEQYSIDEAFLNLSGYQHLDLYQYGKKIIRTTSQGCGVPISLGIGPTKTLAKIANRFAKKYPKYESLCIIDSEVKRIKALQLTAIGDVWGVGRQHEKFLLQHGVKTAYDFTQMPRAWVRAEMTVVGEMMYRELLGEACFDMELIPTPKKQIGKSAAFGEMVTELIEVREAVASFASVVAEKLRKQKSCAVSLMVYIHTNNFRTDLPQYFKNFVVQFPVPTNSTLEIVQYALEALEKIYVKGFYYKKAGVILTEVISENTVQMNMFDTIDRNKHSVLMKSLDTINSANYGNRVFLAIQGLNKRNWHYKQGRRSKRYTTNANEFIRINCRE